MSSPSVVHQAICMELSRLFGNWLLGKPCRVFAAPLDVRLFPEDDNSDDTIVQPDLLVVCDKAKLSKGSVNGPPDLAVEIISPSTSNKELLLKFRAYMDAGIREYWMIEPEEKLVQVHIHENGRFISFSFKKEDVLQSTVLQGFSVNLKDLWENSNA